MIYEWRVYEIVPGKRKQLNERFAKDTLNLSEKHGIKVVGFWENKIRGASNTLYYMLAFQDLTHLQNACKSFTDDPEWQSILSNTEKDGPLRSKISNIVLTPTDYSPLK